MANLKPGDILVFKAGNDPVGKAIAWLTESDVSHAAMMLDESTMVEMGAHGIHAGQVAPCDGEDAILLRLKPEQPPEPLAAALKRYMDSKTRYDFPSLVILAGLIVYRKLRPTPRFVAVTDIILRKACAALDSLIQKLILKNPGKAMVCSQLVYQVYGDCGKDYRIEIDGGLLQAISGPGGEAGLVCLAELAADAPSPEPLLAGAADLPGDEELARELYLALTEEPEDMPPLGTADLGALPSWANSFLEKLEELLEKSGSGIPIDALFITPADIAYKAKNLAAVGKLDVKPLPRPE